MSKILPGVGLLTKEQLRVAKKSFGYRWRAANQVSRDEQIFQGDVNINEARDWWLIAFAHGVEYARVLKTKELFP